MASGFAHELNQPLSCDQKVAQAVVRDPPRKEKQKSSITLPALRQIQTSKPNVAQILFAIYVYG